MRPWLLGVVSLLASAAACGEASPGDGAVELGTGEWEFVPLADEAEVELVLGAQGGYHIWTSLRAEGLSPEDVMLEIETQPADDSLEPEQSRVPVDLESGDDGTLELVGWPAILSQPGCVVDRMLRLRVTLTDARGATAADERYVLPTASATSAPEGCSAR